MPNWSAVQSMTFWAAPPQRFSERPRMIRSSRMPSAHWRALLEGSDACFAPVLSLAEAAAHPHNAARGLYAHRPNGELDAAGAPRFSPLG